MQDGILLGNAAHQHGDFGQHQLSHAARVGERRVEHRNAQAHGGSQIDLVGTNAKAADGRKLRGLLQHRSRELGARADADKVRAVQRGLQVCTGQRFGIRYDIRVAAMLQHVHSGRVYAFQQYRF